MSETKPTIQVPAVRPAQPVGEALPADEIKSAAQQRVDAVGDLLAGAYAKASTLKLSDEDCHRLTEPFPDEAIRKGAKGDETLIYIEHAYMRERLNEVFGPGRWALVQRRLWGEDFRTTQNAAATRLYAECVLLVKGCYVGEAIGAMVYYPNNPKSDYSEASEGAQSEALRRICQKSLGIGLQVYKKDFCEGWKQRQRRGPQPPTSPPTQTAPQQQPIQHQWPLEAWQPKVIASITPQKSRQGREYKSVRFENEANVYSSFHAMQGLKAGDPIWVVTEGKEKDGVQYWNIVDWMPDSGGGLMVHKELLLKRLAEEGAAVTAEFVALGVEKSWLLPNVEGPPELELKHVPRSKESIEALIDEVKGRMGA